MNKAEEAKLRNPIHSPFEVLIVPCVVRLIMGKNWTLSVYQGRPQAMKFSVYLIDLLSILLSCNGFTRIQKAVVDQTGSRPSNSDHGLFSV